ncbi:MAG: hypothetical protein ACLTEE_07980 [Anaerobutyricum hallii]
MILRRKRQRKQNSTKAEDICRSSGYSDSTSYICRNKNVGRKENRIGNSDSFSYKIEIENQVYAFPTKVSAFTDNGWKVDSKANTSDEWILLQKDGKEIVISVNDDYEIKLGEK